MENLINLQILKNDIIYNDKVKKTYNGQGIIRLKKKTHSNDVYVIFPLLRKSAGNTVIVAVDEILHKNIKEDENERSIQLNRRYVGRKCIVIEDEITIRINKRHIIYDKEVKKTYNGQGLVLLRDGYLGSRAYVIFSEKTCESDDKRTLLVHVDEILNKGVHPNNDHTSRVLLSQDYIGKQCMLMLQEI